MSTQQSSLDAETYDEHVQTLADRARQRIDSGAPVPVAIRTEVEDYLSRFENNPATWQKVNEVGSEPHGKAYRRMKERAGDLEPQEYKLLKAVAQVYCDVHRRLTDEQ